MDRQNPYFSQVSLLVRVLPIVGKASCFTLKGGTAINLFYRKMPRLSVDIDLVYMPLKDRTDSLSEITSEMKRIASGIKEIIPDVKIQYSFLNQSETIVRILIEWERTIIKVEVSPVLRGTVFPTSLRRISTVPESIFGFAEVPVVSFEDLFAGKIVAALDRQHPRDLFDIKYLLENEGITSRLKESFIVYLISHNRKILEILSALEGRRNIFGALEGRRNILRIIIKKLSEIKSKITFFPILLYMRKPREIYLNAEYHVTAKINRGEFALESREVKTLFLSIVSRAKKKHSFRLRHFVIMSNHIHFLIKPGEDESLSRIMQWILGVFAVCYNKQFNLQGHVWYDRFKSKVIKSYRQLIATFKYICENPVKAKMAETPKEYEYGGLWFILNRDFELIEPPDPFLVVLFANMLR